MHGVRERCHRQIRRQRSIFDKRMVGDESFLDRHRRLFDRGPQKEGRYRKHDSQVFHRGIQRCQINGQSSDPRSPDKLRAQQIQKRQSQIRKRNFETG